MIIIYKSLTVLVSYLFSTKILLYEYLDIYKKKRGEEVKLNEHTMELEKAKQQHSIQEDRVGWND